MRIFNKYAMVKKYTEANWALQNDGDAGQLGVEDEEYAVANPWYDIQSRKNASDERAVQLCGLEAVLPFISKALDRIVVEAHAEMTGGHCMTWHGALANWKYYAA